MYRLALTFIIINRLTFCSHTAVAVIGQISFVFFFWYQLNGTRTTNRFTLSSKIYGKIERRKILWGCICKKYKKIPIIFIYRFRHFSSPPKKNTMVWHKHQLWTATCGMAQQSEGFWLTPCESCRSQAINHRINISMHLFFNCQNCMHYNHLFLCPNWVFKLQ